MVDLASRQFKAEAAASA